MREQSGLARSTVPAWDLPTRLFKWTLVLLVLLGWVSHRYGDVTLTWHTWNGYAVLILLVFRLLWGVFGSSTARFSTWVPRPRAVVCGRVGGGVGSPPPRLPPGGPPAGSRTALRARSLGPQPPPAVSRA